MYKLTLQSPRPTFDLSSSTTPGKRTATEPAKKNSAAKTVGRCTDTVTTSTGRARVGNSSHGANVSCTRRDVVSVNIAPANVLRSLSSDEYVAPLARPCAGSWANTGNAAGPKQRTVACASRNCRDGGQGRPTSLHKSRGKRAGDSKAAEVDVTRALVRVGQLKAIIMKDPDPPIVAAELASLYLTLSDRGNALKSFQLAAKASPGETGAIPLRS